MQPETPQDWLRQGQALEAKNNATALAEAVQCYDRAIVMLSSAPLEKVRPELAIAWMNFGNARQKQPETGAPADAVRAYDKAISLLKPMVTPDNFALRNTLGAAWMNRGHAFHRQGTPETLAAAIESQDQAIAELQTLPLGENRSFHINLAAAWMNRAHALMSSTPPDSTAARDAAMKTIQLTREKVQADPVLADISLRAHHALCAALSRQLSGKVAPEIISETGDVVEDALAIVRHWERQGVPNFRPIATALFYFGAQFYHAHQPQFLAEFLLENVDPASATGALFESDQLKGIAAAALAQARADAYNRSMANPGDARLQQMRQDLEEAEKRLMELVPLPDGMPQTETTP